MNGIGAEGGGGLTESSGSTEGSSLLGHEDERQAARTRARARLFVLLVLGAGATYMVGLLLAPFLPALVTSAVVGVLVYPAYRRFEARVGHPDISAFIGTVVVFFLGVLPVLGLSLILVDQVQFGVDWLVQQASGLLSEGGRVRDFLNTVAGYLGLDPARLSVSVGEEFRNVLGSLAGRTFAFLSGLAGWILQTGVALFTLFYLLRDADGLMRAVKWMIPLEGEHTDRLVEQARDVIYATMFGHVAVAVAQGLLGGFIFWVLDLPAAALWGTVMGIVSILPAIGPPLVWAPAAAILLYNGQIVQGVVLLAFGVLVISTVDNLLRTFLVSGRAHLHPLIVFFSVLGGLFAFGAVGFFIGPVLFVLSLSVIEIARLALEPGPLTPDLFREGILLSRAVVEVEMEASAGEDDTGATESRGG